MAITFEDLQKANSAITTTNIKGKEYAEVNQRIKAFRMVYPEGFIRTSMVDNHNGVCIFNATVGFYDEEDGSPMILGIGHAYEKEDSSFINKTSYIENCETSSVGRALGMAGFGIDTSVCSAEELGNALAQQNAPITKAQVSEIKALAKEKGSEINDICLYFGVVELDDMTASDYETCKAMLNAKKGANNEASS